MADDMLDFLDTPSGDGGGNPPEVAIQEQPGAPQPQAGAEMGADGGEAVQRPPANPDSGPVPLAAFLDVRDQLKEQKKAREAAETRIRDFERQQQAPDPSIQSDPAGWEAQQRSWRDQTERDLRMQMSGHFTEQRVGSDVMNAAKDWGAQKAKADPLFAQAFLDNSNPYGWLIQQHQREQTLNQLGGKTFEEAAKEWAESQGFVPTAGQQPAAAQVAAPAPPASAPKAPPRSLASATPAGQPGAQAISEKDLGDALTA